MKIYLVIFGFIIVTLNSFAILVEYPDFNSIENLVFYGQATKNGNNIRMYTSPVSGVWGSVWYDKPINVSEDFRVEFEFSIRNWTGGGADGLVFQCVPDRATSLVPSKGLSIWLDTWNNTPAGEADDVSDNNIKLSLDGAEIVEIDLYPFGINVSDGTVHSIIIDYCKNTELIQVVIDNQTVLSSSMLDYFNKKDLYGGLYSWHGGYAEFVDIYNLKIEYTDNLDADINRDCILDKFDLQGMVDQWLLESTLGINSDLIGYWSFDEGEGKVAYDKSGYGNHGAIYGAAYTNGVSGSALSFDGVEDHVEIPYDESLNSYPPFTFSCWVKVYDFNGNYMIVINKGEAWAPIINSDYQLWFDLPGLSPRQLYSTNRLTANAWQHIVFMYDGSNISVYENGNETISQAVSGALDKDKLTLIVGANSPIPYAITAFHGLIDEVRIYNRALSVDEIQYLYNVPSGSSDLSADLNLDQIVNLKDFAILASYWLRDFNTTITGSYQYQVGDEDNFIFDPDFGQTPNDDAIPGNELFDALNQQNVTDTDLIPGMTWYGINGQDYYPTEQRIAHTFLLTDIPADAEITSATLKFHAKCGYNNGGEKTDRIRLGFVSDPGWPLDDQIIWSRPFGTENGAPGDSGLLDYPWECIKTVEDGFVSFDSPDVVFELDLSALPMPDGSTIDIRHLLKHHNSLDVIVEDDTGVDYYQLTIETSEPACIY